MPESLPDFPRATLALADRNGTMPIRRVFCVGRNYAEHAREMGHDDREPPFFFGKSAEAVTGATTIPYPPATKDLHHEIELVVAIGLGGAGIDEANARDHILGYTVGVDLTRRDLQAEAKKLSRPWFLAKSFLGAAPIAPLHLASAIGHPRTGSIWLDVDGEQRQRGDLADMIWSVEEIVAHLSRYDPLLPGDLIFTGTPSGVAAIAPGAVVTGGAAGVGEIKFTVTTAG